MSIAYTIQHEVKILLTSKLYQYSFLTDTNTNTDFGSFIAIS
jgi:hypothetical protein